MIVNKLIKQTFNEIAEEHLKYINKPDEERKYFKRLLAIFNKNLTEEEQIFVFRQMMEHIHFRSIVTDPDNVVQIHNIKLKTITYIFFLTFVLMLGGAMLFKVNDSLNNITGLITNIVKLLSL